MYRSTKECEEVQLSFRAVNRRQSIAQQPTRSSLLSCQQAPQHSITNGIPMRNRIGDHSYSRGQAQAMASTSSAPRNPVETHSPTTQQQQRPMFTIPPPGSMPAPYTTRVNVTQKPTQSSSYVAQMVPARYTAPHSSLHPTPQNATQTSTPNQTPVSSMKIRILSANDVNSRAQLQSQMQLAGQTEARPQMVTQAAHSSQVHAQPQARDLMPPQAAVQMKAHSQIQQPGEPQATRPPVTEADATTGEPPRQHRRVKYTPMRPRPADEDDDNDGLDTISVSLSRIITGQMDLSMTSNGRPVDYEKLSDRRKGEVQHCLLKDNIWKKMLHHLCLPDAMATQETLGLFRKILPPHERQHFFQQMSAAKKRPI